MSTNFSFINLEKEKRLIELQHKVDSLSKEYSDLGVEIFFDEDNVEDFSIHIAKTCAGWKTLFQKTEYYESVKQIEEFYKANIQKYEIRNIYGDVYTWQEFVDNVIDFNKDDDACLRHCDVSQSGERFIDMSYSVDEQGYCFSSREFC